MVQKRRAEMGRKCFLGKRKDGERGADFGKKLGINSKIGGTLGISIERARTARKKNPKKKRNRTKLDMGNVN